jgi:hypothetical protein
MKFRKRRIAFSMAESGCKQATKQARCCDWGKHPLPLLSTTCAHTWNGNSHEADDMTELPIKTTMTRRRRPEERALASTFMAEELP